MELTGFAVWAVFFVFLALSASFILAFGRLLKGPTLADRVVALDLVVYLAIAFMVVYAIVTQQHYFIEAALVLALIAFLGTLAFARYIERLTMSDTSFADEDEPVSTE